MSTPTHTVTINGTEYAPVTGDPTDPAVSKLQIIVADRSWNFIGTTQHRKDGSVVITNAQVIRRWGTTKGLGQLAREGKQKDTILDDTPTVTIPAHAVIAVIDVDAGKWT